MGRPGPGIMSKGMKAEESDGWQREREALERQAGARAVFLHPKSNGKPLKDLQQKHGLIT